MTNTYRENGLNISITVPSTVTNMVAVPKNLDLSKNENFEYDEGGRLYYVDDNSKILCSEYQSNVTDDGRLVVEEGVTGVQVYLLSTLNYDYLDLPSTFCEVGYNNAAEKYPAYTGNRAYAAGGDQQSLKPTPLMGQAGILMRSFPISMRSPMLR